MCICLHWEAIIQPRGHEHQTNISKTVRRRREEKAKRNGENSKKKEQGNRLRNHESSSELGLRRPVHVHGNDRLGGPADVLSAMICRAGVVNFSRVQSLCCTRSLDACPLLI